MNIKEDEYISLIRSSRVSAQTREALLSRMHADDSDSEPRALSGEQLETLRSLIGRILPQAAGDAEIDLAARLDRQLTDGKGDGWRYASLPQDIEAYRAGLGLLDEFAMKLNAIAFARLLPDAQDSLLAAIVEGRLHSTKLDLKRWFEDVRADAVQIYVSQPRTLAGMGYSGVADEPNGFVQIGMGEREEWEPEPSERDPR